jgi:hypothetical protein
MRRAVLFGGIVLGGLLLLGGALFLGVFLGQGGDTGSSPKIPGFAEEKPGLGDTQNVDELSVTLVEAFRTEGDEEELYRDQVPPNGTFVVVRFRVQNGSPEPIKWGEPYVFQAYSTDGRKLNDAVSLSRQIDVSAPREDLALYNTEIRPGGDVTGTIVCIAELDEMVSVQLSKFKETEFEREAVWEFGPVGELPKRAFESQF